MFGNDLKSPEQASPQAQVGGLAQPAHAATQIDIVGPVHPTEAASTPQQAADQQNLHNLRAHSGPHNQDTQPSAPQQYVQPQSLDQLQQNQAMLQQQLAMNPSNGLQQQQQLVDQATDKAGGMDPEQLKQAVNARNNQILQLQQVQQVQAPLNNNNNPGTTTSATPTSPAAQYLAQFQVTNTTVNTANATSSVPQGIDHTQIDSRAKFEAYLLWHENVRRNPHLAAWPMPQQQQWMSVVYLKRRVYYGLPPFPIPTLSQQQLQLQQQLQQQQQRNNMRITVDKRNKTAGDKILHAVDTTGKDHADEVMRRCEEISKSLKSRLVSAGGNDSSSVGGRFSGTDGNDLSITVSQSTMIEACGDTARFFKPYQIVGVNFLMMLYRSKVGGAILADEMGLGKTAQLIAYLGCIKSLEKDPGPHLIVVPASLLENWQRELRRWCPSLKSVLYYGKHRMIVRKRINELREKLRRAEEIDDDLSDLQDADVLAEAAASERLAEGYDDPHDDDPLGICVMNESDDEFDVKHANVPENGPASALSTKEVPNRDWDFSAPLDPAPFNVLLTSYTLFERDSADQKADREFLESFDWSHLIMDEAHALKNRDALRTSRLRRLARGYSRRRIMMTGTPLQNDLFELQNLLQFLLPKVFDESIASFDNYAKLLQGDEQEQQKLTDQMKFVLGPFVLRRLKSEVAGQLTEKKHTTEFIQMTPDQQTMYDVSVQSMRSQLNDKATSTLLKKSDDTDFSKDESVEKFLKTVGAKKINHMFTHLRKIAQHPLLIRHHYDDAKVQQIAAKAYEMQLFSGNVSLRRVTEELMTYSDYSLHAFCYNSGPDFSSYRLNSSHLMSSAKFRFLRDLLPKLKEENSRPLIFSQWTAVLDIIEWLMDELRLPYVRLDGSTAVDVRLATVDRFNNQDDVFAFLLSTRAGGQGLNLTGADTVILHDVDFNPQIDRQAEDRCHRLGQTKPVSVYRLVTKNSVDQNIYDLSQRKLKLDHAVLVGITHTTNAKGNARGVRQKESALERQQMANIMQSVFAAGGKDETVDIVEGDNNKKRKIDQVVDDEGAQRRGQLPHYSDNGCPKEEDNGDAITNAAQDSKGKEGKKEDEEEDASLAISRHEHRPGGIILATEKPMTIKLKLKVPSSGDKAE